MTGKLTRSTFFEDTERSVTLTRAWLAPPWADTFLILRHKSSHVRIGASVFARGRLRHALRASGVTVNETTSWRAPRLPADLPSAMPGVSAQP